MEHNRSTKIISIIALVVAIFGLSIGFAAYSRVLNINTNKTQNISKNNQANLNVQFSAASESACTDVSVSGLANGGRGGVATLSGTTISNLTASFDSAVNNGKGKVTYIFYVRNEGMITAYLTGVDFESKNCVSTNGASIELVQIACNDITVDVQVGNQIYNSSSDNIIDSKALNPKDSEKVIVTISNDGAHAVDGNFTATIDNIIFTYSPMPNS